MGEGKKTMSYPVLNPKWIKLEALKRLYQIDIPIIGLTGGIATGKTSFAHLLRAKNIHVIDADGLIKSLYKRNDVLDFITQHVPLAMDGRNVNFKHLREHVFGHEGLKTKLEQFLYTHMPLAFTDEMSKRLDATWIVYDVPLLFERSLNFRVDQSVVVYARPEIQVKRLMQRDSIDEDFAKRIISQQMDIDVKKDKADYVIDNSEGIEKHPGLFDKFWADLTIN